MLFDPKDLVLKGDFSLHAIKPTALEVVRLDEKATLPVKAHDTDLGYDLFALEDTEIAPGGVTKIRTGIACNFPKGYGALIRDRSSVATKRELFVVAGVIDQEYTGEIIIAVYNPGDLDRFVAGEKIAQMILTPVITFPVREVTKVEETQRGANGFGSTGT
jgi:deoxyuridine 5'-triphosphate nucleotidohydrolase